MKHLFQILMFLFLLPDSDRTQAGEAMVATANRHASEAAAAMLRQGGGAVDAAVAAQMVLSLVEPQSSGIGGGAFMLHRIEKSGKIEAYDGRETAPAAAMADLFLTSSGKPMGFMAAVVGGRAVGVPGVRSVFRRWTRTAMESSPARSFRSGCRECSVGSTATATFGSCRSTS